MKSTRLFLALSAAFLGLSLPRATAHSVWIEPLGNQLVLRFAEPAGKFEKSPGHLDSLGVISTFSFGTNGLPSALDAVRVTNHFTLGGLPPAQSACVDSAFIVMSAPGRPGRKPNFYARWEPSLARAAKPALTLDLVPTGQPGEVRAWFRGQPLGGIKATLRTPDEKEQPLTSDAEGFLRFESHQSGQHMLSIAHHRETLGGFSAGLRYDLTSHNASLVWREP